MFLSCDLIIKLLRTLLVQISENMNENLISNILFIGILFLLFVFISNFYSLEVKKLSNYLDGWEMALLTELL